MIPNDKRTIKCIRCGKVSLLKDCFDWDIQFDPENYVVLCDDCIKYIKENVFKKD